MDEDELRAQKVDELRDQAKSQGITGTSSLRKDELVEALADEGSADGEGGEAGPGEGAAGLPGDAGPDDGRLRTGEQTSSSLQYSQEVTSPDDDPERPGRSLATTNHEVIRSWAESHDAVPATVDGTEHEGRAGVLRLDFRATPGDDGDSRLRHISWDEWFGVFDERKLNFIYQESRKDGRPSTFFRLESPDREDG